MLAHFNSLRVRCCLGATERRLVLGLLLGLAALTAQAQRPQLELDLQSTSNSLTDPTYVYLQAGATPGFDAVKIPRAVL